MLARRAIASGSSELARSAKAPRDFEDSIVTESNQHLTKIVCRWL